MNETTLNGGLIVPSSSILAYVGDGSSIGERVKNDPSTRDSDIGKPIIETRIEYYRNQYGSGELCYRQYFHSSNSCTGRHNHGMNLSGGQIEGRSGSYILYINDDDYKEMQRRGFTKETPLGKIIVNE